MNPGYTPLAGSEANPGRPFTHPDHSADDAAALCYIARRLRALVIQFDAGAIEPRPRVTRLDEPDGRGLRMVICDGARLRRAGQLSVVGFFGQRRQLADAAPIVKMDEALIEEFLQHPDILAYCSLEMAGGNWANLVLMSTLDARQHWNAGERHAYAATQLAPRYYATVRLHNAELPGGLMAGGELILLRTKYYDYEGAEHWRGLRELDPPRRFAVV